MSDAKQRFEDVVMLSNDKKQQQKNQPNKKQREQRTNTDKWKKRKN